MAAQLACAFDQVGERRGAPRRSGRRGAAGAAGAAGTAMPPISHAEHAKLSASSTIAAREPATAVTNPPSAEPRPRLTDQVTEPRALATTSSARLR